MKLLLAAASAAALFSTSAIAQPTSGVDDVRVNQLIIYGEDTCPASTEQEITICAKLDEGDRYRIPEPLRTDPNDPAGQSWTSKALELQYVGRTGIGSCSPVGPGGMIGCYSDIVRAARAERATRDSVNWNQLIEQARQERLAKIDAQAAADEADAKAQAPR